MDELTQEQKNGVALRLNQGVSMSVDTAGDVRVEQISDPGGVLYTQKELHTIGRALFPAGGHISPLVMYIDLEEVTSEWIKAQMERYGIKRNDLARQTGLSRETLGQILRNEKPMSRTVQALFSHYFRVYQLSKTIKDYGEEE